ncbi:MAG: hypothetical protein RJA98_3639 [Pseudomonadota bacterium]
MHEARDLGGELGVDRGCMAVVDGHESESVGVEFWTWMNGGHAQPFWIAVRTRRGETASIAG